MNGSTKVSVIINNFNYENYISAAIASVEAQTYKDIELIVVDDGSTDHSVDIVRKMSNNIKLLCKENGGQASAFNVGYRNSSGKIVIFLDSDDALREDAIEKIVDQWQDGISKLQFYLTVIDANGNSYKKTYPPSKFDVEDVIDLLSTKGSYVSAPTSGNAFSRHFLDQVMPIPEDDWRGYADCYLIYSAPFFGPIKSIDLPLAFYRRHSSNMTNIGTLSKINLNTIRSELERDRKQQNLINHRFSLTNLNSDQIAIYRQNYHLRLRLISIVIEPSLHPFYNENARLILLKIFNINNRNNWKFSDVMRSCWSLCVFMLPRQLAIRFITISYRLGVI